MSSAIRGAPRPGLFQVIDWRLVAAVGLPVWAFLIGVVVTHRPATPRPLPAEPTEKAAVPAPPVVPPPAVEPIPAPREVVIRTVEVPVPVPVPAAPAIESAAASVEFKLPPSEVMPADRCKTFDTKIRFHPDLASAAEEAKLSKKMLLVLHISGNFDDPGFT
jgi:hypothetical protein